jgi:PAS domain S-box-containing protein
LVTASGKGAPRKTPGAQKAAIVTSPVSAPPHVVFEHAEQAMTIVDGERHFVDGNPAASRLLGTSRKGLLERRVDDCIAPREHGRLEAAWQWLVKEGGHAGPFELIGDAGHVSVVLSLTTDVLPGRHVLVITPSAGGAEAVPAKPMRRLSPREREMLDLLSTGARGGEIAKMLSLSPATVNTHIRNLKTKLGARTRTQAVAIALRQGIID